MRIRFDATENIWEEYNTYLEELASQPGVKRICDIGGGANPALSMDFIERNRLEYVVLDISPEELAKAPNEYSKVQADITSPGLNIDGGYDLVFSKFVAEHVRSGRDFHNNVRGLLSEDGIAFHFFPTLYAPPFVINRLVPEWLSEFILLTIQPGRTKEGKHSKFPAYYSWCRGPVSNQIRKFESLGYRVEEYTGFFGHWFYYEKVKLLKKLHNWISSVLVKYPVPWLTSFAYVVMVKEGDSRARDKATGRTGR